MMLGEVIGDLLPSAVGVALSPVPIVAAILVLDTARGRANGPAFAAGWVLGLGAVTVAVLWLAGGADDNDSGTSTTLDVLKLLLGGALLLVAAKQWQARPQPGQEPALPKWMSALDDFPPGRSLLLGAALAGINPKNLVLAVTAGASIAQGGLSSGGDAAAVTVFVTIGSLTVAGPVLASLLWHERSQRPLATARGFMADNNAVIMAVVCLVLAAKLAGNAIAGLTD